MPVTADASDFPTFRVTINDVCILAPLRLSDLIYHSVLQTAPVWVFCKQTNPANHCAAGMVFSVNAIETGPNNFDAFQAKAKASGSSATGSGANQGANGAAQTSHSAGVLVAVFTALVCALVL